MAASTDDKYRAAEIDDDDVATFVTTKNMKDMAGEVKTVIYNDGKNSQTKIKYYDLTGKDLSLIGINGKIKKNARGIKDGEDWYFFSKKADDVVIYYSDDKDLLKALEQNGLEVVE